jgi:hypothetical protein
MNADLNNSFKYDKIVINLNSDNCLKNASDLSYYINLSEPLKNVVYIKMLKASVKTGNLSSLSYEKFDPIYISLNDYDRSLSYKILTEITRDTRTDKSAGGLVTVTELSTYSSNIVFNTFNYFDLIQYSGTDNTLTVYSDISYTQTSFDWTDPSVYILNPPEQNLKRLNIQIKGKNFAPFTNSQLLNFNLSICIYVIKNRV